jgi:DNA topoisomerase IB
MSRRYTVKTIQEYALQAWAEEREKQQQARAKKAKKQIKKMTEELEELFAEAVEAYRVEPTVVHPRYEAVLTVTDANGALQFTYDAKDELTLIGMCPTCQQETTSPPIDSAADLGKMLERFAAGKAHICSRTSQ